MLFRSLASRIAQLDRQITEEQMQWLRMIKEHIAASIHIEPDDLDLTPFDAHGMWQLFGERIGAIIDELNEVLTA